MSILDFSKSQMWTRVPNKYCQKLKLDNGFRTVTIVDDYTVLKNINVMLPVFDLKGFI